MITGLIVNALATLGAWILGLMGSWSMPSWFTTVTDFLSSLITNALALGNWIPWPAVGLAFVMIYGSWAVALTVRLARIIGSFLTVGGGSAG